uniref:Protein kinase domain-containing protein n=1 Tax=Parascaris univalens TaxID=6257 RepID=A0A915CC29_PARUN
MAELIILPSGKKVGHDWTIDHKLGAGSFGAVYRCSNSKGEIFALKVEGANEKIQLLKMELYVLTELNKSGGRHFCRVEDKGRMENFIYVVMTLVGRSLQDLRVAAPMKKFSLGTAIGVGIQCLEALEDLHSIGYLHRDVKPGNYSIGRVELHELRKIYVLDFGMCRKFIHDDGTIKKPRTAANFRGTVKYAPVACHLQRELCRLDDCETWLYMLVEITKGSLPWRNLRNMEEIGRFKRSCRSDIPMKQLFGGCPREYIDLMRLIDGGKFFDEPKYGMMYSILRKALNNLGVQEFPYDWEDEEEERSVEENKAKDMIIRKTEEKKDERERKERKAKEQDEEGARI